MVLETVFTQRQRVQLALDAHAAHLFPQLHGVHGCPAIRIAMDEEHGGSLLVETEIRYQYSVVVVTSRCVRGIVAIREDVGGIDAQTPLHIAGQLVDLVDWPIGLMHRGGDSHQRQVSSC